MVRVFEVVGAEKEERDRKWKVWMKDQMRRGMWGEALEQ